MDRRWLSRWFKILRMLHKEWNDTGVSVSRDTTHGCLQEKSGNRRTPNIKKLLKKRHHECLSWTKEKKNKTTAQWSRGLFSDEIRCFAFHLEIKVPEPGGRMERHIIQGVWNPADEMSAVFRMSFHLLVLQVVVHCILSSPKSIQQFTRRYYVDKQYGDPVFLFHQHLSTVPNYYQMVYSPYYYCTWLVSQLAWPEPQRQ